ncbi:MAG: YidC/Oxa1 family membrane protein insertase [Clostridia bacterium]|nr:YidC/Oxa1 family membrane protein insertase [Clostridia bacterium]
MNYIYSAMGWILKQLYDLLALIHLDNYAYAIILFTILVNLVFLPLSIKQQKATAKQAALRPKLEALKEKCGDDQRRYQTEMQALYQKEGVSMMGGCWTLLIRLPFLWGVWQAIRSPLSYILNVGADVIANAKTTLLTLPEFAGKEAKALTELDIINHVGDLAAKDASFSTLATQVRDLNFNFFGINLTETPDFTLNLAKAEWIWIIPLLSFATAMLSSIVSLHMQKKTNPQAASMGGMMLLMPLMSLWIAFQVPGAVGFYWACSNLVNMVVQFFMNKYYGPYTVAAREAAKTVAARKKKEQELKVNSNSEV